MRTALATLLTVLVTSCAASAPAPISPRTDQEKTLYAVGVRLQMDVKAMALTPAEVELVLAGFRAASAGKAEVTYDDQADAIEKFVAARLPVHREANLKAGEAYREKAAREPGAVKTASGLIFTEMSAGTGRSPDVTEAVRVNYRGKLIDGHVFEATRHGLPVAILVGSSIGCWSEALQRMKPGGKARLVCPPSLAYGDRGWGRDVTPGSTLVYELELAEILPK